MRLAGFRKMPKLHFCYNKNAKITFRGKSGVEERVIEDTWAKCCGTCPRVGGRENHWLLP